MEVPGAYPPILVGLVSNIPSIEFDFRPQKLIIVVLLEVAP